MRMADSDQSLLLSGEVLSSRQVKILSLTAAGLKLEQRDTTTSSNNDLNLTWCEVISAETSGKENDSNFSIHYIELQKDKRLRQKTIVVTSQEIEASKWVCAVQMHCQKVEGRPKKLFVIVNPIGGGGKGRKLYKTKCAPLFKLAGCETTVVETEFERHAVEIGENQDFTGFDGIISVGGDGLYQEILQGYFVQLQKAADVDINDINASFVKPKIPFCLIPAGSFNGIVQHTNDRVVDIETSALRVLIGEIHPTNLMTVHEPNRFMGICALGLNSGYMADIMKRTDSLRWMGVARYYYGFIESLFKRHRHFQAHVEILKGPTESNGAVQNGTENSDSKNGWINCSSEGTTFTQVFFNCVALLPLEDCTAVDPYAPTDTAILDYGCTIREFFKLSTMFAGKKIGVVPPCFKIVQNVIGMRFKILRDPNETEENISAARAQDRYLEEFLHFDGEILRMADTLEVEARLKSGYVPMFGCLPSALMLPKGESSV